MRTLSGLSGAALALGVAAVVPRGTGSVTEACGPGGYDDIPEVSDTGTSDGLSLLQRRAKARRPVEPDVGSQGATPDSAVARRAVIVDTDADIDDLMAITFLLNDRSFDVLAITVEANGFSSQWAGVSLVMRLTQRYGVPDLPVAFGARYSETQLNAEWGLQPNNLPLPSLINGSDTFLTEWVPTPFNPRSPSPLSASQLIIKALKEADGRVDILALGAFTNLADALHRDSDVFLSKVGTIYVSGGGYHPLEGAAAPQVDSGSSGFPYTAKPKGTSWNIFLDAISANQIFGSGVNLVVIATNAQHAATVHEDDDRFIPSSCLASQRKYLTDFYQLFPTAAGRPMEKLAYWDPVAAAVMVNLQNGAEGIAAPVCTELTNDTVSINLESGTRYSWMEGQRFGSNATICTEVNPKRFKEIFYTTSCSCLRGCGLE